MRRQFKRLQHQANYPRPEIFKKYVSCDNVERTVQTASTPSNIFKNKGMVLWRTILIPGGRVLLGILGRGVPPGSPNPDPISDQNMPFSTPVFRPLL